MSVWQKPWLLFCPGTSGREYICHFLDRQSWEKVQLIGTFFPWEKKNLLQGFHGPGTLVDNKRLGVVVCFSCGWAHTEDCKTHWPLRLAQLHCLWPSYAKTDRLDVRRLDQRQGGSVANPPCGNPCCPLCLAQNNVSTGRTTSHDHHITTARKIDSRLSQE